MLVASMNGYEIIGFVKGRNDGVILGRRQGHRGPEWVTARVDVQQDEWPREWFWGHYFENNSEAAFADFVKRASECHLEHDEPSELRHVVPIDPDDPVFTP